MSGDVINTVTAKNEFNSLVAAVNRSKTPVIVAKRGEPVAVIMDYGSYQQLKPPVPAGNTELVSRLKSFHKDLVKNHPGSELDDSVATLRELRLGRHR